MAPQDSIPISATILGLIGTIFWCVQLLPQIWRNYRAKSTEGLPTAMMFLWACSGVPFGVYAIVQKFNIPICVQPQCFGLACLISWAQCIMYGRKWRAWTTTLITAVLAILFAGLEVLLIFVIRGPYSRGVSWPVTFIGILAAVLLLIGYVPVPFELWKRRGRVIGIDFIFLTIDSLGAFFSLMAIVAQHTFDILGGVMYAGCAGIEVSIFISQAVWLYRTRHIRRRAREANLTWDEYPEAQAWQEARWKFSSLWKRFSMNSAAEAKDRCDNQSQSTIVEIPQTTHIDSKDIEQGR